MEIITCRRQNCTTKGWSTNGCLTAPLPHRSIANLVSHSRSTASGFGSPPCFYASTFPRKKRMREREKGYGERYPSLRICNPRSLNLYISCIYSKHI